MCVKQLVIKVNLTHVVTCIKHFKHKLEQLSILISCSILFWRNNRPSMHHEHSFPMVIWSTLQIDSYHHHQTHVLPSNAMTRERKRDRGKLTWYVWDSWEKEHWQILSQHHHQCHLTRLELSVRWEKMFQTTFACRPKSLKTHAKQNQDMTIMRERHPKASRACFSKHGVHNTQSYRYKWTMTLTLKRHYPLCFQMELESFCN